MISSNTRSTRSRYSSPAQVQQNGNWNGGNGGGNGAAVENPRGTPSGESSRSFMAKWLEPSIQSKTSFEEAGLMRYGVLENMAPLGAMPKPKKPGPEPGHPVRRIVLRPSGSSAANHASSAATAAAATAARDSTPKPKQAPAAAASSPPPAVSSNSAVDAVTTSTPASAPPQRKALPNKGRGHNDDEDYEPKETSRRRRTRRSSISQAAAAAATTTPASAPAPAPTSAAAAVASAPASHSKRPRRSSGVGARKRSISISMSASKPNVTSTPPSTRVHRAEVHDADFTDKVIEAAVDEALSLYRYPTAWALRTLYDENSGDPEFVAMIEEVFHQTADAATREKFFKLIAEKKREGKKDNQGCYYFVPPATNSRFTPRKPKPAPYAKLLHHQEQQQQHQHQQQHKEGEEEVETRAVKKIKISHAAGSATTTPRKMTGSGHGHGHGSGRGSGRLSSRKRARRGSHSSDSSLSSAMSLSSPGESVESVASPSFRGRGRGGVGAGVGGGAGATGAAKANDAPKTRPIKTRGKSLASRHAVSNTSDSNSPTHQSHPKRSSTTSATNASMPGRLAASELFPNLPQKSATLSKETARALGELPSQPASDQDGPESDDGFWNRRIDARKITNGYTAADSSLRGSEEKDAELDSTPARNTRRTRQSLMAPISTRATRSASKRPKDEADGTVSPVSFSFPGDSSPVGGSRAATPSAARPSKKQRSGLRIKSSPVKKKGGTAAGVPRSTGESQTSSTNGAAKDQASDNDEYCSACGNTGDVVCCDGCPRSFHFECVDMSTSESLPDEWYCNECLVRKWPSRVPVHRGVFGSALNNLEKSIPRAFSLPKKLQNRFEGVKAGADGDYEEVSNNRLTRKKNGYDELPDFFKQREDGQAVLCHLCQKSATEIRAIIPCSVCPLYWHIDCLDPPLAVPPVLKTWRCPAHAEEAMVDAPPLAPAHRFRKVKGTQVITPALPRGNRNNGHIEVDWSDEPEETNASGWPDPRSFGRVYRLPAKSVVLDFIEQLRRQGAGHGLRQTAPARESYPAVPFIGSQPVLRGSVLEHDVAEMQVSLTLANLKQGSPEGVDQLTSALLAGADESVLKLIAQTNADNLSFGELREDDKQGLRALAAQMDAMSSRIRQVLGNSSEATTAAPNELPVLSQPAVPAKEGTPVSDIQGADHACERPEASAPVTEPTPPSTIDHAEGTMDVD